MGRLQHQQDLGRRLLAESIQLQQRVAQVPLPPEPPKGHPVLRNAAAVAVLLLVVGLCWVLAPPALVR
ncbi:MAG: hypothetical protein ACXV4A_00905 [Actinomycetes bacterium]